MKTERASIALCQAFATVAFEHGDLETGAIALFGATGERRREVPKGMRRTQAQACIARCQADADAQRDC